MRVLLLCLAILCGCDGSISREGIVIDSKTKQPIAGAEIWFADRVYNTEMKTYLDGKTSPLANPDATSAADGTFHVKERLAGPGGHEVWMVVRAEGYIEDRRQIWKGTGLKGAGPKVEIALAPSK